VLAALQLAGDEPELAGYLLAKAIVLGGGEGLSLADDDTLATTAMERRWRRKT
jgi:hypothetical protein